MDLTITGEKGKESEYCVSKPMDDFEMQALLKYTQDLRTRTVDNMCLLSIPSWRRYLMKKFDLFRRVWNYAVWLSQETSFESDFLHEKLTLVKNGKEISERVIRVRFK